MKRYILVDLAGKEIRSGFTATVAPRHAVPTTDGGTRTFKAWDLAKILCAEVEDEDPTIVYWEVPS